MIGGQEGVFEDSTPVGKNPKPDGPAARYLAKSHPELRAGMEEHPRSYRASGAVSSGHEKYFQRAQQALLGD